MARKDTLTDAVQMAPLVARWVVKAAVTGRVPQPETDRLNEISDRRRQGGVA